MAVIQVQALADALCLESETQHFFGLLTKAMETLGTGGRAVEQEGLKDLDPEMQQAIMQKCLQMMGEGYRLETATHDPEGEMARATHVVKVVLKQMRTGHLYYRAGQLVSQ